MNKRFIRSPLIFPVIHRIFIFCLALIIIPTLLSGCNYERHVQDSDYDYGAQQKNDPKMLGTRMYGSLTGNPDQHDNKYFEYSSMLSREVSDINGVATAIVMLTDKNAYVGIALDWTAVGTKRIGGRTMKEQNNTGSNEGVYNHRDGTPYYNNRKMITPYNSYFSVNDHNLISRELKQTIAKRIRRLSPNIEEVHISANKDFVNEMVDYAKEAWLGRPLEPWVDSFNILVKYQFDGGKTMPTPISEMKDRR
ncbi:hypothetical protein [Paenibacillus abyssi]|uniref:Sporulation protein n=1 Tax=Paenibacillus abyssi TaxID=1340531 RepID=A0A917LEJ0_9BACL|nr:hypothetical protein [Paenibacillus abyssi]GGG16236.1 hypothetical protein GCM10010916_36430 [Paenibacillus abyssi]